MKRKDLTKIIFVAIVWGIISMVASGAIFKNPVKNAKVPVVTPISTAFPLVSAESDYQSIFNSSAIDPTQLIQIGNSQNNTPFASSP